MPQTYARTILEQMFLCVSLRALTCYAQVTAQFIMYRKNYSAESRTPLSAPEVEPLLCEEVELSALQDAERTLEWTT